MSPLARLYPATEARRGSRIDLEGGGCYLGIPRNRSVRAFTSVQRTGCGTPAASDIPRDISASNRLRSTSELMQSNFW